MKLGIILAALFLAVLSIFAAACSRVENISEPEQQPVVEGFPEIEVKEEGCAYDNPPCPESHDCIKGMCVLKGGCSYGNPMCNSTHDCVSNACVLKKGCDYNNPGCDSNHNCVGNVCILKEGCRYNNPGCNSSQICQNNKCFEHILSGGGGRLLATRAAYQLSLYS